MSCQHKCYAGSTFAKSAGIHPNRTLNPSKNPNHFFCRFCACAVARIAKQSSCPALRVFFFVPGTLMCQKIIPTRTLAFFQGPGACPRLVKTASGQFFLRNSPRRVPYLGRYGSRWCRTGFIVSCAFRNIIKMPPEIYSFKRRPLAYHGVSQKRR